MDPNAMSVDELIAASVELGDRPGGLFDRLAGIIARAGGEHGVTVEVNLDGMLVGLELSDAAVRLRPDRLAEEIYLLTQRAAGVALAEGITMLEPVAGEDLLSLIDLGDPALTPVPLPADEDFSAIESWAIS